MSGRARTAEAAKLLAQAGIAADVTVAGQAGDIAVVAAPVGFLHDIAAHAAAIRELGFRYVALEIGPGNAESVSG